MQIRSVLQQILLHGRGTAEDELVVARRLQNALLHHAKFDLQDLLQVFAPQRAEDTTLSMRFMNSGENLRRAASTAVRSIFSSSLLSSSAGRLREAHGAVDQLVHLSGAQVGGHHDQALREIDAAVVAERQRRLVKDAEQQLP